MDRLYINFGWVRVDIDIQGDWLSGGTYPTAIGTPFMDGGH